MACWSSPASQVGDLSFSDATEAFGLIEPLTGLHGHAAGWADFNGDGLLELFVGTFADREPEAYQFRGALGPSPDRFLTFDGSRFRLTGAIPDMFTRTSGASVADLDNDGDLDLVLSRNWDDEMPEAPPTQVFVNDGGTLVPVADSGLPVEFGGRSVGVLDFDQDGSMDLFIAEDRFSGSNSRLMRNTGGARFEDVTEDAGIPAGVHGLGVAVADLTNDGHRDILVTGSNRLFIANGDGSFRESDTSALQWTFFGNEDDVAGTSVADVNRDGWLDVLIGQHFNSTVDDGALVPVRLYLNRGVDDSGFPILEDVTEAAGLPGLPTKAPHVEINDLDNDGWPDLVTTASAAEGTRPVIFRHLGLEDGIPSFEVPDGIGDPQYWVAGPTADVDRDGRLDILLVEWEPSLPSIFLRNETPAGNWLEVSASAEEGFGIGWRVEIYEAGALGASDALLGAREIVVTQGYSSGVAPVAHFGLGPSAAVDVRLVPPGGADAIVIEDVAANQHIRYPDGC